MLEIAETTSSPKALGRLRLGILADCLFLSIAALLPVLPWIRHLDIYADDWGLFRLYRAEGGRTFSATIYQSFHYYSYGPNLMLYDVRRETFQTLSDIAAAREYLPTP